MRRELVLAFLCMFACGNTRDPYEGEGPIQRSCSRVGELFCCGLFSDGNSDFEHCQQAAKFAACALLGSAPEGGCAGGKSCIRSNVDFDACEAAIAAIDGLCSPNTCALSFEPVPGMDFPERTCAAFPDLCKWTGCETAGQCAEEPY